MKLAVMLAVLLAAIVASAPVPESDSLEQVVPEMSMDQQHIATETKKRSADIDKKDADKVESDVKKDDTAGVSKATDAKNDEAAAKEHATNNSEQEADAKEKAAAKIKAADEKAKADKEEAFMVNMLMCQSQGDEKDCKIYCESKKLGSDEDTEKKKKKTCMKYFKAHKPPPPAPPSAEVKHAIKVAKTVESESEAYANGQHE